MLYPARRASCAFATGWRKHKHPGQILSVVNDLFTAKRLLLNVGTAVDVTLILAPSSTKYQDGMRDPDRLKTLFALSDLRMVHHRLVART